MELDLWDLSREDPVHDWNQPGSGIHGGGPVRGVAFSKDGTLVAVGNWDCDIRIYDVKNKEKVEIPEDKLSKKKFDITTKTGKKMVRYAFVGETTDGRNLTKFCSEGDFNASSAPEIS